MGLRGCKGLWSLGLGFRDQYGTALSRYGWMRRRQTSIHFRFVFCMDRCEGRVAIIKAGMEFSFSLSLWLISLSLSLARSLARRGVDCTDLLKCVSLIEIRLFSGEKVYY